MLEEVILALWSAVNGFFTPAVFFILLNVVIGTIAVTSTASPKPAAAADGEGVASAGVAGGTEQQQQRQLSSVPSMAFERLRSFNLSRVATPAPEPATVTGVVDLGYEQPPAPEAVEKEAAVEREREAEHAHAHVERSRSEAAAEPEVPRLPARLHKSASDKSAFAHFEAEEVEEAVQAVEKRRPATTRDGAARRLPVQAVEKRRPATTRDGAARRFPVQAIEKRRPATTRDGTARRLPVQAEPEDSESESSEEEEAGGEVDAQAENFINKFHNQLKLQRMESILRYRENIRRGQAAAGGV